MSKSLQDQLLGAGLLDKKKAKQIAKQKKKQQNINKRNNEDLVDEAKINAQKALKEKQEKDKTLNRIKREQEEKKAIAAQIVQLIKGNELKRSGGDIKYSFSDGKLIKSIYVTKEQNDRLVNGVLCIAKSSDSYYIIPKPVAEKIAERDAAAIIVSNSNKNTGEVVDVEDDYYAQFEIPDDLMW